MADPAPLDPLDLAAHAQAAIASSGRQDWGRAVAHLRVALAIQPDYDVAFTNLARVEQARGNNERAAEYATVAERLRQLPSVRDS